jgi:subtilisin family serine protease
MIRTPTLILFIMLAACGGPEETATTAEQALTVDTSEEESFSRWFVELSSAPLASGGSESVLASERQAFRDEARRAGISYTERATFQSLFNGFSIQVGASDLAKVRRMTSVKDLYPVVDIEAPEVASEESPDLATAIQMTGASVAQSELGLSGAGIRVGIIDTGVDYDHPDLGGCFGPGCRVQVGHDFVGDAYDQGTNPVTVPDLDPDDCNGHGTHVSGIVGASGQVTGVAPGVTFGAYRVFGCVGSTSADIMLQAMEMAYADGMNVVNMSIGSSFQWPNYPTAQGADRLVQRGVVVVCSAGNSGANGLYASGAPSLGHKTIAVANFDNSHISLTTFTVSPDNLGVGYIAGTGGGAVPTSGSAPLAVTGSPSSTADGCASAGALPSLAGRVALIRRGSCTFYEKARRAELAGAIGVVIYNNAGGFVGPSVAVQPGVVDSQPVTIPVVGIQQSDGITIHNRVTGGGADLTWTDQLGVFPNATGGLLNSSSSYGPSPDLTLKPDLGAPGGFIRSTYPLESGGYASLTGTSMSSPHVAGSAALLLEARPNTPPALVRDLLSNSAEPARWFGNPNLGFIDVVHRQGAGMVQVDRSVLASTIVSPSKLSLGESEAGPATHTLTVTNDSAGERTYSFTHQPALSTGANTNAVSFSTAAASVSFTPSSITIPANGSAQVGVTITAPAGLADRGVYGGYLIASAEGTDPVRVPYAGFKGDYQSIQVLTPTAFGFPWLARLSGTTYTRQADNAVFTLANGDLVYFLVHLEHQSRRFRAEIFSAPATAGGPLGRAWNRAFDEEYLPRNSTATGFFAFPFDGRTTNGRSVNTLPDGSYVLRFSVLKALGDPANPAHWETWISPTFVIDRP